MTTWFTVKEVPHVAKAGSGSRPGTSLADFIFSVLYAKTLTAVRTQMVQKGVLTDFSTYRAAGQIYPLLDQHLAADTTYADDSGFYTMVPDNGDILTTTKRIVT